MTYAYDFDADLDHEWCTKWRIPIVNTVMPTWRYEVALVIPSNETDLFQQNIIWPTEDEAEVIGSFIDYRMTYYNDGWARKMREQRLDVDSSTNTVILGKRRVGWGYRLASFTTPALWPYPETPSEIAAKCTPDKAGLIALLDKYKNIGDHIHQPWLDWKTEHPEIFS